MTDSVRRRKSRGSITRAQVVDAAERAVRAGQFEKMTIRSIAADLEVGPMSLYRHVRNKDDLLDAVVDRILSRRWRPRADIGDWTTWTTEFAVRFREFLVSEPAALYVYLRHPVTSPAATRRMQALLQVLTIAGFSEEYSRRIYATVHTYTIGFAALESSRARFVAEGAVLSELYRIPASFATPGRFQEGLGLLLSGIAQTYPRHPQIGAIDDGGVN